jgi:hypothetical protein
MARNYPDWIKGYMEFTEDSESPTSFSFWTAVWVIAGALQRRVWIDMRKFQWTPNFYIIFVGPPGIVAKSTCAAVGWSFLSHLPNNHFGPESLTWQGLGKSFEEAFYYAKYLDAQGKEQTAPMSALNIFTSELGTMLVTDDQKLLSFLIEMWDGKKKPFEHKTATAGTINIDCPLLNILGCTTPSWIQDNFTPSMIAGGLASRIIFVYADQKRALIPYPDEMILSGKYWTMEGKLLEDLKEIAQLCGPYTITGDARDWGRTWYAKHWNGSTPRHMASARYSGYMSRKYGHIHKLAMILAAARRDVREIHREDLESALTILEGAEPNMIRVFESIGVAEESRNVNEIVAVIRAYGALSVEELWGLMHNTMELRKFKEAVTAAGKANMIHTIRIDGTPKIVIRPQAA